ncbi:MAG TPA: rod shape-determining protein [Oligoflexus sp.]|uniref:rod shape-determining protein n=1 Tax=Oligoflexus sp. TaxID=1971216 RepID=UPI002D7EAA24|nr:rod shape-determining protein [Oligoflexus sp.]HET9235779.1 rod shape-determining protein [Oligoflexus sp.]
MIRKFFRNLSSIDVAIDLGTSHTSVYIRGEGLVYKEPSVISLRDIGYKKSILAIGNEAFQIMGKEPQGVETIKPLQGGVIDQLEATKAMLNEIAKRTRIHRFLKRPRVLIGAPYSISDVERRAVIDATSILESPSVTIVEEPLAAAIGADLDISESIANMVVDIGSGITEAVVISLGGIVHSESIRIGGDAITESLVHYFRNHCNLIVGERTVEELKPGLCDVYGQFEQSVTVKGIDVHSYLPQTRQISSRQVKDAILGPVSAIIRTVRQMLENTPPVLSGDLIDRGIILTGGSALLQNLASLMEASCGVPVKIAKDSAGATLRGTSRMLEEMEVIRMVSA